MAPISKAEAFVRLEEASAQYRKKRIRRGVVLCAMLVAMGLYAWQGGLWGVGLACALAGLYLLVWPFLPTDDLGLLLQMAHEAPEQIVWVYPVKWEINPYGLSMLSRSYLKVHFMDGEMKVFRVHPDLVETAMPHFNALFPDAAFGYTEERAGEFEEKLRR